jgi:DNA replication protein DnaD
VVSLPWKKKFLSHCITGELRDQTSREDVTVRLSTDGNKLSEEQVKNWIDNTSRRNPVKKEESKIEDLKQAPKQT